MKLRNTILDVGLRLSNDETVFGYTFGDASSNIFDGTDPARAAILWDALAP